MTKVALASASPRSTGAARAHLVLSKDLRVIWKLSHVKFLARAAARHESRKEEQHLSAFVDRIATNAPADAAVLSHPILHPMFEAKFLAPWPSPVAHSGVR